MKTALVSEHALRDLEEIHDFVARDKPLAARRLIANLQRTFQTLATFPELGARCELLGAGLRNHTAGSYIIFYGQAPEGIEVVRVLHGSRQL